MTLNDTAKMMCNKDYRVRFVAEYHQVSIRYKKLLDMCKKWDEGTLDFTPTCPRLIYDYQLKAMEAYKDILETRAGIEDINLEACDGKG